MWSRYPRQASGIIEDAIRMKVHIKGLNVCPLRKQNLLHYQNFLEQQGHSLDGDPTQSDVIMVWTCGFRSDVIENSISELNEYQAQYRGEVIAVGCLPDIDRKRLDQEFGGTFFPWKQQAGLLERYFGAPEGSFAKASPVLHENAVCVDAGEYRRANPDADVGFSDQFFKLLIGQGCPYDCAYCTEKLAFPPYSSVSIDDLLDACRVPVLEQGQRDIILLSDCLGRYGIDTDSSLPELIRSLHAEFPQTTYILSNLHPSDFLTFREDFREFIKAGWIKHLNLPFQSGSSRVLARMNRGYTRADLEDMFTMLRELNFERYDTHLIAGFPGETEEDFLATVDLMETYRPRYALVSKYYDASGAASSQFEDKVSDDVVNARLELLSTRLDRLGIILNLDGAGLMQERMDRINRKGKKV